MGDHDDFTSMRSLMSGLAKAMNLVDPAIERHHEQTAYLALFIARQMGMPEEDVTLAMYAALLHDIGSLVVEEPQSVAEIEANAREVSMTGARMLADLPGFADIAGIIGYCQCSWASTVACAIEMGEECERLGRLASVVHLADVASVLVRPDEPVLAQVDGICEAVRARSGTEFCPEAVDALLQLAGTEFIWMDLAHNPLFLTYFTGDIAPVSLEGAVQLTGFMSRIIDFRSPFTAMHSAGVAAAARELALLAGMDEAQVMQMEIAGNLHDIGKLAVPRAILEKPGKLTHDEFAVIREHPYYTAFVLNQIDGFGDVARWASQHHERLDGRGYPFHSSADDLDCGARIMAVADIFSAITEERPYRAGMTRDQAADALMRDVRDNHVCGDLVALLLDNYERVDAARDAMSRDAGKRYFASLAQES